jgi:hypothetical protein
VRRHGGPHLRERRVLAFIGRPDHGVDDHVGVHQLHDVPFEAGEGAHLGFSPVAHRRIADRRLAIGRHTPANPWLAARRIWLEILRQEDVAQRGERSGPRARWPARPGR